MREGEKMVKKGKKGEKCEKEKKSLFKKYIFKQLVISCHSLSDATTSLLCDASPSLQT